MINKLFREDDILYKIYSKTAEYIYIWLIPVFVMAKTFDSALEPQLRYI